MDRGFAVLKAGKQPSIFRTVGAVVEECARLGVGVGSVANVARPTAVALDEMQKCRQALGIVAKPEPA